jgi:hypothetical protein
MNEDDYTIDISTMCGTTDTITITNSVGDICINTSTYDWITIDSDTINLDNITIYEPVEFEDEMPTLPR